MFLFESSKDKELKKIVEQKFYECVGKDTRKFEQNRNLLISYCRNSEKTAIKRMVDLIKANIKDDDIDVKQKLFSLYVKQRITQLLRDAMQSRNKVLGNYVVEKIFQRLTILAKFKKESQDPQRGKELFGKKTKQDQQMAARFLSTLLQCFVDWGNNWPKESDGPATAFKRALDELVKERVALPAVRDVSPKPKQPVAAAPTYKPQRQAQQNRRIEPEVRRGDSRQQPQQTQQSLSKNDSNSAVVASQKQVRKQSTQQTGKFDHQLVKFMVETNSNFELLSDMIQQPEPQIIRQVVKAIENGFENQPRLQEIFNVKSPIHESAAELIGGDFGFIQKINKDLPVIQRKPDKKTIFRDKYVNMLSRRRQKYENFMAQLNSQSSPERRQQREEVQPPRPARQNPKQNQAQNRRQSQRQREQQQMREIQEQREIQRQRQLEREEEKRLQAQARKEKEAEELYQKKMEEMRRQAELEEARRRQEEENIRKQSLKNLSKNSLQNKEKQSKNSLDEFNQFVANAGRPSQLKSDKQFQEFQANLNQKGSAEDFFGACFVPTQEIRKSGGLEDSIIQKNEPERNSAPSLKAFETNPFESNAPQTRREMEQPTNPFASTQQKQWTNPFMTQTKKIDNRPSDDEPQNPFEDVPKKQMIQSAFKLDWTNPFERAKHGQATNPFEHSVISQLTEKTNPFEAPAQQSPKMNDFEFLHNLRGSMDSNNAFQQRNQNKFPFQEDENPFNSQPFKKKPTNEQRAEMNPFDAFTTIQAKPDRDRDSDFNVQFFQKSRKSQSQFGEKQEDPFGNFAPQIQHQKPKQPLFPSVDFESGNFFNKAQLEEAGKRRFYTEQNAHDPVEQKKFETLEPLRTQMPEIQHIQSPKSQKLVPPIKLDTPKHEQMRSPKSEKEIQKQFQEKVIKLDPTNPLNNPYGDPTKIEKKSTLEQQLQENVVVELDFLEFKAVKKIGIPWNPFTKKNSPSPAKNEILLKMHLDKLIKNLNEVKNLHEEEHQLCAMRHRGFLQVRNEYMEKKKQLQEAEKSKVQYSKMIIKIEQDITRKEKLIASEFRKVEMLNKLKEEKNSCLRKLFECQNKRKNKLSELPNGAISRNTMNKFKMFNETARSFHNIVSMSATSRSRADSYASVLTKAKY